MLMFLVINLFDTLKSMNFGLYLIKEVFFLGGEVLVFLFSIYLFYFLVYFPAQSSGVVEYTDCISAEG